MRIEQIVLTIALAAGFSAAAASATRGEDANARKGQAAKNVDRKDGFAVPEGGVKELLAFIQKTLSFHPTTREEYREFHTKGFAAMKEAAERIKKLATEEDKALPEYAEALGLLFGRRVVELDLWFGPHDPGRLREERRELIADLKEYFAKNAKPSEPAIHAARQLGIRLEFGEKPKDAIPIYQELGPALASSADPQAASTGLKMLGAARRLGLVGKPLELTGTALDGGKFDLQTLRGKVVLVDFWATWCRPCLAEMPNVKKNYELYHDKGFEVVGISLDDDRAALEKFLSAEQHPWITLYDGEWDDSPVATYYGIMGIPSVILVGQDGNVVATDALGPKLGKLLAELLGPVQDSETSGESSKSDAAEVN